MKTNIGREFLKLLDRSFPVGNPLRKVFNRNTVKIGYKCMPNMAMAVSRHNKKILQEPDVRTKIDCKCDGGPKIAQLMEIVRKNGLYIQQKVKETISGQ